MLRLEHLNGLIWVDVVNIWFTLGLWTKKGDSNEVEHPVGKSDEALGSTVDVGGGGAEDRKVGGDVNKWGEGGGADEWVNGGRAE